MDNEYILKHNNVEYLIQQQSKTEKNGEYESRTVSYYQGALDTIDFSFARLDDHINLDPNQFKSASLNHVYINSINMVNTTIKADQPLNTTLHIMMNHRRVDSEGNVHYEYIPFIRDLRKFLPTLLRNNKQVFNLVFDNTSADLGMMIVKECKKYNINCTINGNFYKKSTTTAKRATINFNDRVGLKELNNKQNDSTIKHI